MLSGQLVNWEKFDIFLSIGIAPHRTSSLRSRTGMKTGSFPFIYLGVPIFIGAPKTRWLKPLADRVLAKLES